MCTINQSICLTRFFFCHTHSHIMSHIIIEMSLWGVTIQKTNRPRKRVSRRENEFLYIFYHILTYMTMNKIWNLITRMNHKMEGKKKWNFFFMSCQVTSSDESEFDDTRDLSFSCIFVDSIFFLPLKFSCTNIPSFFLFACLSI